MYLHKRRIDFVKPEGQQPVQKDACKAGLSKGKGAQGQLGLHAGQDYRCARNLDTRLREGRMDPKIVRSSND